MRVILTRELAELHPHAECFLAARVERNVAASLLAHARAGRLPGVGALFAWGEQDDGSVAFFAMRTPPWPLLVGDLAPAHAEPLMEAWLLEDPDPPGVSGAPAAAQAVAAAWSSRTGGRASVRMRDAVHVLAEVIDPLHWPQGAIRLAREEDRELLIAWERAFVQEAGVIPSAAAEAERTVARRLASGSQLCWQHGEPVSTLATSPEIAGTIRIGPVYTPPEHRRRGYASAAVARVCGDALARGARQCMLFTDLANPTSNKIYAAIGFRRVADWEELDFSP